VSKSTVSRVWRKIKADWEAWTARDLFHRILKAIHRRRPSPVPS
jgi:hypothetical protein